MLLFDYPEDMRGKLIAAARVLLGMSQADLGERAKVARQTLTDLEREEGNPTRQSERKVVEALERAGIEFVDHGDRIGVFLNLKDEKQSPP